MIYKGTQAETLAAQFPNVPEMISKAPIKSVRDGRCEDVSSIIAPYITIATLEDLLLLGRLILGQWLSITECAPKMEDALVELGYHITLTERNKF